MSWNRAASSVLACSPVLLTRRQCQAQLPVTTVSSEAPQCQGNTNGFPTSPFPGRSTSAHTRAFWLPHISLPSLLCGAARYRPPWRAACVSLSTRACHTLPLPRMAKHASGTCLGHQPVPWGARWEHSPAVPPQIQRDREIRTVVKQNDCIFHLNEENDIRCCYSCDILCFFPSFIKTPPSPCTLHFSSGSNVGITADSQSSQNSQNYFKCIRKKPGPNLQKVKWDTRIPLL